MTRIVAKAFKLAWSTRIETRWKFDKIEETLNLVLTL